MTISGFVPLVVIETLSNRTPSRAKSAIPPVVWSVALRLSAAGHEVTVHEAAGHAGGRCRSFHDDRLGLEIDNGNHLLLSGNRAAMAFLDEIGARDALIQGDHAAFPFVDFADDSRWTLRPNRGRLPWWIFSARRRVA